jgi:hypothetical protein
MEKTAALIAIFAGMFVGTSIAIFLPLFLTGKRARAAQEKARARRLADARINARLLRLNL